MFETRYFRLSFDCSPKYFVTTLSGYALVKRYFPDALPGQYYSATVTRFYSPQARGYVYLRELFTEEVALIGDGCFERV